MGWFSSLFGGLAKLAGLLKMIPGLGMVVTLAQAAFTFVKALQRGDIAGAFKSLIGPAIDLALSAIPLAGTALGKVGDMLADKVNDMIGPMMQQLAAAGLPQAALNEVKQEMTNFTAYLRSPMFTQQLAKSIGHDAADVGYVLTGSDASLLRSGMLSGFDSLFAGFLSSPYAMKGFPSIMGLHASENTSDIINKSMQGATSSFANGSAASLVALQTPPLTATIPLETVQSFPVSSITFNNGSS